MKSCKRLQLYVIIATPLHFTLCNTSAGITVLVSYIGRPTLFCESVDLVENIQSSTGFCKFSGESSNYIIESVDYK